VSNQSTLDRPDAPFTPDGGGGRRLPSRTRFVGLLTGALLVAGVVGLVAWFAGSPGDDAPAAEKVASIQTGRQVVSQAGLVDLTGVRIARVTLTAGGGLVDLRYQVVDPDKAAAVHDPSTPPGVIDEETGVVVNNLFMGHMHKGELKAAVTYYLVFENPGDILHRGSTVSVLLGNAQVEHVVVG
jgi:hypothetical protein